MRVTSFLLVVMLATSATAGAWAADLAKMDRTIAKEPHYRDQREYCLLVFGPDAATRVWLIFDGNILYADRNGDRDLTQGDERFGLYQDHYDQHRGLSVWTVGDIAAPGGKTTYKDLTITRISEAGALRFLGPVGIGITVRVPIGPVMVPQSAGGDVPIYDQPLDFDGYVLKFADRPEEAPIVHFGGELTTILDQPKRLTPGADHTIYARIGTPGLGKGTAAVLVSDIVFSSGQSSADLATPVAEIDVAKKDGHIERLRVKLVPD